MPEGLSDEKPCATASNDAMLQDRANSIINNCFMRARDMVFFYLY